VVERLEDLGVQRDDAACCRPQRVGYHLTSSSRRRSVESSTCRALATRPVRKHLGRTGSPGSAGVALRAVASRPHEPPTIEQLANAMARSAYGKGRTHAELARLEAALAAAHGENLELRRRIGRCAPAPPD
jgi:hypothetical protein